MGSKAESRRRKREKQNANQAARIREAHSAGNAFDRLHGTSAPAAVLPEAEPEFKPKFKSRKHKARQQRKKAKKAAARQAAADKQKAAALARKAEHIARRPRRVEDYPAYLRSAHWKAKRKEAFAHYGRSCSSCPRTDMLQVHHRHYRTLHREQMEDLQILCESCHLELHEADPKWVKRQEKKAAMSAAGT